MVIIISIIYYVFLRYSPEQIITYNGYAIEGKTMVESLKNSDMSKQAPYLGLIEVQENDLLYKRLNSYYIGEDDKKEIDINYPIYINDGNALLNLGENTKLITVNYEEVEGYPDFMMADGVMYNGTDITRADGNKYLFLKSEDEIYTNVEPITITTANGEYTIREFSNIYFAEDHIAYYEMEGMQEENQENNKRNNLKDSYLQYKQIKPIDPDSKTKINGETITYKTLLERLDILQTEESNANNNKEENTLNETEEDDVKNTTNEENTIAEQTTDQNNGNTNQNTTNTENNNNDNNEDEWQEGMWEKPEVSCTDFESDVYTISTNLSVRDRANVISRGITFEIYLDGRLNRRVFATKVGNVEISNLQPSSEYEIKGIFYYTDENGVEVQEEFYTGKVTTKSIDTLGTIDFSFQNGEIYSNKIELKNLKINNNIEEEVIKGISRLQVEIGDVAYRLSNNQVNDIKAGKEITYQTSESLTSNSKIKYKITAFDRFGNELKEKNNEGETITSKQMPTASIRPTKQDVTEIEIEVTLNNKDNVKLENYRYEITNKSGEVVKSGALNNKGGTPSDGTKETLKFNDLDPNGYYQIVIYGDYDLEDGTGVKQNAELGRGSFVTRPIASLGYMQVKIDDKEITQNSMNLEISIDANQTDARLLAILDKIEVVIYDQGKNVENVGNGGNTAGNGNNVDNSNGDENNENESNSGNSNNSTNNLGQPQKNQEETEVQRITFTQEQVQQLKTAEEVELNLESLNSNTKYRIDVITTVKQGTVEEIVEDKQNIEQLITLKMPAEVQIKNQFVIGTMIDLDMRIEDIDNAVLTNKVRIEVRDKENKLIDLSEMQTNVDYERKTYEDLTPNEEYRIIVYAPQYNIGSTDETYEADYVLKEIKIVTETGISGKLDLIGLEKAPTGKNLIDVSSKVNWFERCFDESDQIYGLNYNEQTKILTLGGTGRYKKRTYYDLGKYLGQEVTISFKARSDYDTDIHMAEKNDRDAKKIEYTYFKVINDLNSEWKEYEFTTTLSKTGYIGFVITEDKATVEIQDLQIELGSKKTDYEEFKYEYNANIAVTVNDARDEIATNDYYIRIYKNNEQIQELRYEEIGEDNKVENAEKTYNIDPGANYKIELLVKIGERYYELDSQDFTTEGAKEIKGILNLNDFLTIQPYGEYIVLNDIELLNANLTDYTFGGDKLPFEGTIDFNGNTVVKDYVNGPGATFSTVGENGILENLVFTMKINNEVEGGIRGFVYYNYGTIRNIQVNVVESTKKLNATIQPITHENHGLIENFIVNLEVPMYTNILAALVSYNNYGVIKNGYAYGENIQVLSNMENSDVSSMVTFNRENAIIENIYTLVNIDALYPNVSRQTNICGSNYDNATIQNVYSVGVGKNRSDFSHGSNVYGVQSANIYNSYYFADEIFTSKYETKGNELSLWDTTFQNQIINKGNAFIVDELVNQGYYPWLNMPECMPTQEYIELPEVKDADLPDILSTKILEQGSNTVKVEFSVNNPSSETISDIQIENLETEILSQEYSNGKSTVIAELKNPAICVSKYNVLSLSTKGAYGSTYKREYEEGERVINVDLYKEIWNVNDWKEVADSPTENYMLMTDLNFINEGNTISISRIDGILNGNGHTISNIILNNNIPLIRFFHGTMENIYINNFKQESTNLGGMLQNAEAGSKINNVHMTNVNIVKTGTGYVGGITWFAYSSCTITNCSVNNMHISTQGLQNEIYIGGVAGGMRNATIENCYVQGLEIEDSKGVSSAIGGIAGIGDYFNTIKNCYTEGKIVSNNINVGGIVGNIGTVQIENCYSKVNIETTNTNLGGIVGSYSGTDINTISNNLSLGDMYTGSGLDGMNRIIGNDEETKSNNYAYEKQLLNGYVREEEKGATLLNKEEVLNLNLGEDYNYDKKEEKILPKLYNTEGTKLLPNQEDIFIDDSNTAENVELEVENIEASKPNTTEAEITARIKNPNEVEIIGLEIGDMEVTEITRNVTQNGITSITARATPTRYYDSYKLTGIKYKNTEENQGSQQNPEEQTKEVQIEIPVQFYKEIYTYEDWQSIEEGTYQNYRLMADIDFSGRANIKNNITVNRLEAENNIYTLKNIELTYNTANTGLINNIKTSIKNIGFENIKLTNTASSGSYFGLIASSNGNIEHLQFNEILVDAKGMDYVGIIGSITSGNIEDVELKEVSIKGNNYTGGFVSNINIGVEATVNNINGENITVESTGNYVGGIIGYQNGNSLTTSNITINKSNITGNDYIGGILGFINYGYLNYIKINETNIYGNSYVGGVAGEFYFVGTVEHTARYLEITKSQINGTGNYIGGVSGYIKYIVRYIVISDSEINAPSVNSQYIGGICGQIYWRHVYYFQIINSTINSNGDSVGGVIGLNDGSSFVRYGYINNLTVSGETNVGGVFGNTSSSDDSAVEHVYVKTNVKANSNSAGAIMGFANNINMTATSNRTIIRYTIVLDSTVTAPSKAGGLIGNLAKELNREVELVNNNYVEANIICNNSSTGSLLIGDKPEENEYATNTYVYKYSKLNGNYVYATNDNIDDSQYLLRTDLDNKNTYLNKIGLGTAYWNYESLSEGKYPKIGEWLLYKPELQTGVDLPTDPEITEISLLNEDNDDKNNATTNDITAQNSMETQNTVTLPNYKVYPISANEINIDFSGVVNEHNIEANKNNIKLVGQESEASSLGISFKYFVNGQEQETVELNNSTNQTYTFKYNFKDTIEIKLTRKSNVDNIGENSQANLGLNESTKTNAGTNVETGTKTNKYTETIVITPEDVRSEASLVGDNNAYLVGTNLYINGELQQGEYVNVYEGYALRSDGIVINIATGEIVENTGANSSNNVNSSQTYLEQDKETTLEQTPKPLHTYDYKGNHIEVYGTYSKINGNIKLQIYNVRSGKLSALSNSLDMKIDNSITDNYNNKEYQTILNTSGELVDLKEMLKYPDNFLTRNIKQIVQNTDEEKTEVMVLYNTGKVIVFNYVSGEVVYETNEKADEGLTDYIAGSIENIWNDYEEKRQEYAKSKELEQKLAELPIEKAIEQVTGITSNKDNQAENSSVSNNNNQNKKENDLSGNSSNSTVVNNANSNGNSTSSSNLVGSTNSLTTNLNNNYITVYNAETGKYEVYSENEILKGSDETPVSETEKITQNGLEGIYGYNAKEEAKPQTNGAMIVISTIAIAIISLIILRKVVIKNNVKKKE